jgi:hypothetical protein
MRQCHAAIRRGAEQAPLPLIPRLDPERGREKTLSQSIEDQDLRGNTLLSGQLV